MAFIQPPHFNFLVNKIIRSYLTVPAALRRDKLASSLKLHKLFFSTPALNGQMSLQKNFGPHACMIHNASLRQDTKQSPHQMFTGVPSPWRINDFRVFGCPVFVLDKWLQDGDSLPKWKARSWTGVYVGHSLQHAGNVQLIYNPSTTHVSPQYHVMFDDQFTTVCGSAASSDDLYQKLYNESLWTYKSTNVDATNLYLFEFSWSDPPPLNKSPVREKKHSSNPL